MPKWLHNKLARSARKRGLKGKNAAAYIYGTMAEIEENGGVSSKRSKSKKVARPGR